MALWDVFHSDRLELVRGLSAEEVASGLASGAIRDDDLVRPSGTAAPWVRLVEVPELLHRPAAAHPEREPGPELEPEPEFVREREPRAEAPEPASAEDLLSFPVLNPDDAPAAPDLAWPEDDFEDDDDDFEDRGSDPATAVPIAPERPAEDVAPPWELGDDDLNLDRAPAPRSSHVALPAFPTRDGATSARGEDGEDDDDDATFSLTRSGPATVEELDLAAMVDVAFQLVLFFLVTATTILYKTLEIPKPSTEAPPGAVAQGRSKTLDDLSKDYIVVEIDAEGNVQIDHEPVPARLEDLAERLRESREKTGRATMLLSADFSTPHRSAVLAYDAANEVALGIAVAKPAPPQGPAPSLKPAAKPPPG